MLELLPFKLSQIGMPCIAKAPPVGLYRVFSRSIITIYYEALLVIKMDTSCSPICEDILNSNLPPTLTTTTTVNIHDIDDELLFAHEESQRSGSIIPLLKQELKCKIQSRRLTEGKEELSLTESTSSIQSTKLSAEEMERKRRRRDQNRRAAKTFRQKEKERIDHIQQEIEVLEQKNGLLRRKLSDLGNERNDLVLALRTHMCCFHVSDFYTNIPVP
ncbi:uncharacterized protein LOC121372761 [Gigantopelta aegis]|uniref:uncharacterized protein LOC121372761 n=1 Tax=Gigantopelta aegis TaxID=1735272 RepID=UPI001B887D6A|nr:uncharacterized protein LOC121372761 [Gigantopelta aegis]